MNSFPLFVTVVVNQKRLINFSTPHKIAVVQIWHGLCLAWCYHVYFDWPKVMLLEKLLQAFSKFILTWPFLGLDFTWLSTGVSSHQEFTDMVKGDLRLSWDNWGDEHQGEKNICERIVVVLGSLPSLFWHTGIPNKNPNCTWHGLLTPLGFSDCFFLELSRVRSTWSESIFLLQNQVSMVPSADYQTTRVFQ